MAKVRSCTASAEMVAQFESSLNIFLTRAMGNCVSTPWVTDLAESSILCTKNILCGKKIQLTYGNNVAEAIKLVQEIGATFDTTPQKCYRIMLFSI